MLVGPLEKLCSGASRCLTWFSFVFSSDLFAGFFFFGIAILAWLSWSRGVPLVWVFFEISGVQSSFFLLL